MDFMQALFSLVIIGALIKFGVSYLVKVLDSYALFFAKLKGITLPKNASTEPYALTLVGLVAMYMAIAFNVGILEILKVPVPETRLLMFKIGDIFLTGCMLTASANGIHKFVNYITKFRTEK